jgi:hypothetical protein
LAHPPSVKASKIGKTTTLAVVYSRCAGAISVIYRRMSPRW